MNLNGINLVPESQRVVPGRPAGPAGGRHGRVGRQRHLGHGVPAPVAAGRQGRDDRHPAVARTASPSRAATGRPPAIPGTGVELTLDESVQYVAEQALAAEIVASHATGGTAVVMDVKSGDILAMANLHARPPRRHDRRVGRPRRRPAPAGDADRQGGGRPGHVGADADRPVRHPARRRRGGAVQLGGHPGLRAGLGVQAGDLLGGPGRRGDRRPTRRCRCRPPCPWASTRSTTPSSTARCR